MRNLTLIAICIIFSTGIASAQSSLPGGNSCQSKEKSCASKCKTNHYTNVKCIDACKADKKECDRIQAIQSSTNKGKITPPRSVGTRIQ